MRGNAGNDPENLLLRMLARTGNHGRLVDRRMRGDLGLRTPRVSRRSHCRWEIMRITR